MALIDSGSISRSLAQPLRALSGKAQFSGVLLAFVMLSFGACVCSAGVRDPFPQGFLTGGQGTLVWSDGPTGRSPWAPSSFLGTTSGYGVAVAAIDYYDDMDNFTARSIYQAGAGGWWSNGLLLAKAGLQQLDVLDMYLEQDFYGSIGAAFGTFASFSVDARTFRIVLVENSSISRRHIFGEAGLSLWVPWRFAAFSLSVERLLSFERMAVPGTMSPMKLRAGAHTISNRFGAQGITIEVTPQYRDPVRFSAGEELRFGRTIALQGSFSTNPAYIGAAVCIYGKQAGLCAALINHPLLGWSRAFAGEFARTAMSSETPHTP